MLEFKPGEVALIHDPSDQECHNQEVTISGPIFPYRSGELYYPVVLDPWVTALVMKRFGNTNFPAVKASVLRKRKPPKQETGSWEAVFRHTQWRPGVVHDTTTEEKARRQREIIEKAQESRSARSSLRAFCQRLLSPSW